MAATIQSRVNRGVKLLDEKAPGWVYKVKITELDISEGDECVLGQVFGDYFDGLDALGIDGEPAAFGFDNYGTTRNFDSAYERLTERWKSVIRARRGRSGTRGGKR